MGEPSLGYSIDNNESECVRLTTLSCRVLRFILHNILLISSSLSLNNAQNISKLMKLKDNNNNNNECILPFDELTKRMKQDWNIIKKVLIRNIEEKKISSIIERVLVDKHLNDKIQNKRRIKNIRRNINDKNCNWRRIMV